MKAGRTSSYLPLVTLKEKGVIKVDLFFRFILLGISLAVIIFIFDFFLPKLKLKFRIYKEKKLQARRKEQFKKMMQKLEIK